jgi:hypothetical protein
MENIDLEEGKILVDGKWLTEDEIRYAIKMKVESDDYSVADLATALQTLISEMNKSRVLKVRVPKEMAENLEEISQKSGESLEATLRGILIEYLNIEGESTELPEEVPEEEEVEEEPIVGIDIGDRPEESKDELFEDELESEEEDYILGEKEEKIDIGIEDVILDEEDTKGELLDIESEGVTESEEVVIEGDLKDEEIADVETVEEHGEIEEVEEVKDAEEGGEAERVDDVEDIGDAGDVEETEGIAEKEITERPKEEAVKKRRILRRKKLLRKKF